MFNIFKKTKKEMLTLDTTYGDEKLSLNVEVTHVDPNKNPEVSKVIGMVPRDFDLEAFVELAQRAVNDHYRRAVLIA